MLQITSTNNARVKQILQLQKKSSVRHKTGEFVIEGVREFLIALKNNYQFITVYFYDELISENELISIKKNNNADFELVKISKSVFQKLAVRNSTEGIIAVGKIKNHEIKNLQLPKNPLLLVAESIEKPGNVGAMLRTCDGAGVDALILVNPVVDIYNPNLIRASLGTVFSNKIAIADLHELHKLIKTKKIKLFAATLQNSNHFIEEDYTKPTAIAVGSEAVGLSEEIRKIANQSINIEMKGHIDSLNVSVSAAVLVFEAIKQRKI